MLHSYRDKVIDKTPYCLLMNCHDVISILAIKVSIVTCTCELFDIGERENNISFCKLKK